MVIALPMIEMRNRTNVRSVQTHMRRTRVVVAALIGMVATACGATGASEWGPLALVAATGDMARNEGMVVITDACVFLERDDERGLLVWPADRTRWDRGDRSISFTTLEGHEVTVQSGQPRSESPNPASPATPAPATHATHASHGTT